MNTGVFYLGTITCINNEVIIMSDVDLITLEDAYGNAVDIKAEQFIELQTGFEVQLGAEFHGIIENCPNSP